MNENNITHTKVAIIGSGPAGLTAGIYAARAGLSPIIIAGITPGGQLMITSTVENYPGFADGILGPKLMQEMMSQAENAGATMVYTNADNVVLDKRPFTIQTDKGKYTSEALIIATGASAKWLNLESEQKLIGKGVTSCATCDGFFYKGKDVAVIGGGDTAMEEAMYLSNIVNKVYLVHRRDEFRASKIMIDRVNNTKNIEVVLNSEVMEVLGKEKVDGIKVSNNQDNTTKDIAIEGLFVAIGHKPNTEFLENKITLNEHGYIETEDGVHTNIEGVFVAGDVEDYIYRQAVTAAGMGCKAAITAERWLSHQGK